jgi:hypothetical protein|nr:MAG TPA: hypothetical protein [Caudoviricetes sp.]
MVRINPALIPETETKLLAMTFLDGIRKFYSDPKNVEKFHEWQRCRQAEKTLASV